MEPIEKIRKILKDKNGILLTSDLVENHIPRTYLSILEKNGEIQRRSRGVYFAANSIEDEMVCFQVRYKRAIYSHETALYLHELTDRTPLSYSVTVPAGYNATSLKESGHKVFFVKRELYGLGLITIKTPHGNSVNTFDLERTICDLLRSRNQIDIQIINDSLKRYVGIKTKNIGLLSHYAKRFRIQKIIRQTVEMLL